jgi:hypothetical protein
MLIRQQGMSGFFDTVDSYYCALVPSSPGCAKKFGVTLAPGSTSPGLPVDYVGATPAGAIPSNPTGETVANPYTPIYDQGVPLATEFDPNADNTPWYCKYLGIGCGLAAIPGWAWAAGLTLGGVVILNAFAGGRR